MIKDQKGITISTLVITIVLLLIVATVSIKQASAITTEAKLQNLNTNMLLIQAKAKIISEKNTFDADENPLKGEKLSTMPVNEKTRKIDNLRDDGVISEEEENYDSYYIWNQELMNELGLNKIQLKDDFYIVNYETEEIIYSDGFTFTDGIKYYKLSETIDLL